MSEALSTQPVWDNEVPKKVRKGQDWVWHGFLAKRFVTLLTSQWKSGKTTLLSMLLGCRASGGDLAGLGVTAGKTAVVSEEPLSLWADRIDKYGFGGNVCFFPPPFIGAPSPAEWQAFLESILAVHQSRSLDLVAIDPLAPLLRCESNARNMLDVLQSLKRLTDANLAVLILHHPAKGDPPVGQYARGHGSLLSHVAVSIEMRRPTGDPLTRRRRLMSDTRFDETPRQLLLELNLDATEYRVLDDPLIEEFERNWRLVQMVLEDAPQKFTSEDILSEWPPEQTRPHPTTLWRWLCRAVDAKMVQCEGEGKKRDPRRYWLRETEEKWRQKNPLYDRLQERNRELKIPFQSWQERQAILRGYEMDPDDPSPPLVPMPGEGHEGKLQEEDEV